MKKTADVALLLIAFIWGATFVIVQNALSFLEAHSFNAVRFFIAFLILLLVYILFFIRKTRLVARNGESRCLFLYYHPLEINSDSKKETQIWSKTLFVSGFKIGIWLFLGYAFQTLGLNQTTPAKAGFITGLSVVMVPLFSVVLLKLKLSLHATIGVITATIGLYLMTIVDSSSFQLGDLYILLCAFSFAMQIIITAKYARGLNALALTIVQLCTVSLLSFLSAVIFNEDISLIIDPSIMLQTDVWIALLVTSVFATAFAFLGQTYLQAYISPTRVALIFSTEPVFSALTSYFWIGEKLTATSVAGCILILFGMIFAELPLKK